MVHLTALVQSNICFCRCFYNQEMYFTVLLYHVDYVNKFTKSHAQSNDFKLTVSILKKFNNNLK